VDIVDEAVRETLSRQIYEKRRTEDGSTTANTEADDTDDEDLIGYDPIEPGLPPASSDKRKWWLDNGKPARSDLKPSENGGVPNPNRPSNPYTYTDEPDWVTVPRMPPRSQPTSQVTTRPPNLLQSTNGTRKLPPPFDPSDINTISKGLSQTSFGTPSTNRTSSISSQFPPTDYGRRLSTSTNSSTSKKPPPVARKPVHLTSSPSLTSSSPTMTPSSLRPASQPSLASLRQTTADHTGFAPPPRRTTASSLGTTARKETSTPPPPPQPRRAGGTRQTNATNRGDEEIRPGLPPRPPTNLLDDDDDGMNGWEALKPT